MSIITSPEKHEITKKQLSFATDLLLLVEKCQRGQLSDGRTIELIAKELNKKHLLKI